MRKKFRPPAAARFLGASSASFLLMLALTGCEGGTPTAQEGSQGQEASRQNAAAETTPTSAPTSATGEEVTPAPMPPAGSWRGSLLSPGGPLTFGLEFVEEADGLRAVILNGTERRPAGLVTKTDTGVEFRIPPYQSRIVATNEVTGSGTASLIGVWERDRGKGMAEVLPFAAINDATPPAIPELSGDAAAGMSGRWAVTFEGDDDLSVGVFNVERSGRATGTFLTTLGDYRYLAGYSDGQSLHLACFDGAHAFLFRAKMTDGGDLDGEFWSRDSYHTTWTATKSKDAALPDDFELTQWTGGIPLSDVRFPDVEGTVRGLDDEGFRSKARLLVVFGTWCPNCNDLTEYLVELDAQYPDLGIVGIAFEMGDDPAAHARAVRDYATHHGATYPILIGGISDKAAASKAFPLVDRVRAYPTTVFMDGEGNVSAVHTGFSGPATGDAHETLKLRFESEIESLLAKD